MSFWESLVGRGPDLLGLLQEQADVAIEAAAKLAGWLEREETRAVDDIERTEAAADKIRIELNHQLAEAIETPLDPEDTGSLSNRLDDITDAVKFTALLLDALAMPSEEPMRRMVANVVKGLKAMRETLGHLPAEMDEAQRANRGSMGAHRDNQHLYIETLPSILREEDAGTMLGRCEIYRQLLRISAHLQLAAKQLDHALQKLR
jgi:uncharacterized protein Yka (UPF0111/DUF47 family)